MRAYTLAEEIESDLEGIREYIALFSIDTADEVIAKVFEAFDFIAKIHCSKIRRLDTPGRI